MKYSLQAAMAMSTPDREHARQRQRQHDRHERAHPRRAIDPRGLLDLLGMSSK